MTKKIYAESIKIMVQECCNRTVFERTLRNKLGRKDVYKSLIEKEKIDIHSFNRDKIDKIKPKGLSDKKAWKQLLEEYTICWIENLKCFSLVVAFPFYGFENEH
jgi:hypothetical protein